MHHVHYNLGQLDSGRVVEVRLQGNAANVRLLDEVNYEKYIEGATYDYRGGFMKHSPVRMQIASMDHWHIVVDMLKLKGSVSASYKVLPANTTIGGLRYPVVTMQGAFSKPEDDTAKTAIEKDSAAPHKSSTRGDAPAAQLKGYMGEEPFVFISYSHANTDAVYPIIQKMDSHSILLWYDEGIEPGADWSHTIAERIKHCEKFILFVSPEAVVSKHVWQELSYANSKNKTIIPIHLTETELNVGYDMILSMYQAIYYFSYKDKEEEFYSRLFRVLEQQAQR